MQNLLWKVINYDSNDVINETGFMLTQEFFTSRLSNPKCYSKHDFTDENIY